MERFNPMADFLNRLDLHLASTNAAMS